jgi:tRNA threonylcarbamoyladenosine biosynthesis protein TsaB
VSIDTSTSLASIAAVRGERLAAELTWDVGRKHSQELLVRLDQLLALCHATPADLTAVAVALGPGSFNGVRVAVTAARSLAFALGLPLYGCSTLDVIALGHLPLCGTGTLCAVLEAGRGELYAAWYLAPAVSDGAPPAGAVAALGARAWRMSDYAVVTPQALADAVAEAGSRPVLICGEWKPETRALLEAALGPQVRFAPELGDPRASWLARWALEHLASGAPGEAVTIGPIYVRRPAITVSARHIGLGQAQAAQGRNRAAAGEEGDERALPR